MTAFLTSDNNRGPIRTPVIRIDTTNLDPASEAPPTVTPLEDSRAVYPIANPQPLPRTGTMSGPTSPVRTSSPVNLTVPPESPAQRLRTHSFSSSSAFTVTTVSSQSAPSEIGDAIAETTQLPPDDPTTDNPFAFSPKQLSKLHDPRDLNVLRGMGGLSGLCSGLRIDLQAGLSPDENMLEGHVTWEEIQEASTRTQQDSRLGKNVEPFHLQQSAQKSSLSPSKDALGASRSSDAPSKTFSDRIRIFGSNQIPTRKPKNLLKLMWMALHDKILILLCIAAVISLVLGFYQSFRPGATNKVEWVEGVAILVAVAIVTIVQSINDFQKERQFIKLNRKKDDREVKAIRAGQTCLVNVHDVMVGDVLHLEPGDLIPVDGVLFEAHGILCDESAATGESDALKKVPADFALSNIEHGSRSHKFDPFILSGAKVLEGVGKYLVTAVGPNSYYGKTMMSLSEEPEDTPLQLKLNRLADLIAKVGGSAALLLFIILFIRFLVSLPNSPLDAGGKGQSFMQILIVAVTIVVVAVPEGLPLAVTLALAYATMKMLKDNNLVRVLKACETMGNATTICSDKTGTLTQNKMSVVACTIGVEDKFGDLTTDRSNEKNTNMQAYFRTVPPELRTLLRLSIALNTTAFEGTDDNGAKAFIGSKTETALLDLAKNYLGMDHVDEDRRNAEIVHIFPFSSERKCMGCVVKIVRNENTFYRFYVKGASELLLQHCTRRVDASWTGDYILPALSNEDRKRIENIIIEYATQSLRMIGVVYRDLPQWPPHGTSDTGDEPDFEDLFTDMIFLSVMGIMDPLRPGVTEAVESCRKAGVFVRMVTGDNVLTAKAIATECGIYTPGGLVMEGPQFRLLSPSYMTQILPRLQVLARSSPEDKRILVKKLKEMGETVAVTGDGTNDGPALKTADVGFAMGISGTEVAKEASSIILMDDNFASIVRAIMWGRCVSDAVKKFLQFQLTVNVTAVFLAFLSAVTDKNGESVLTAVQLLWVNLIMDTFAALALATDPPTLELLDRKPEAKGASMISFNMWKMIMGQAVLQLVITFILHFGGHRIFTGWDEASMKTVVFNTFVWLQIFNEVNCRRLDNKLNVFSGMHRNPFFVAITLVMIGGQVLIIFVGGTALSVTPLNGGQWATSVLLGLFSLPFGVIVRLIPNRFVSILVPGKIIRYLQRKKVVDEEAAPNDWNHNFDDIREQLLFIKTIRNRRRLGNIGRPKKTRKTPTQQPYIPPPSPVVTKTRRRQQLSRASSTYSVGAIVPALVVTSMMRSPTSPESPPESAILPTALTRQTLETIEGLELHRETDPEDPVVSPGSATYHPLHKGRGAHAEL